MLPKPNENIGYWFQLPRDDCFRNVGALSPAQMESPQHRAMVVMGRALVTGAAAQIKSACAFAREQDVDPNAFCYSGPDGQWFTPLLALLARQTQKQVNRALSILEAGPRDTPWDLGKQCCQVPAATGSSDPPVKLGFVQAAPSLVLAAAWTKSNHASAKLAALHQLAPRFLAALDKWPGIDWNAMADDGHTALSYMAHRMPLGLVLEMAPMLVERGADPHQRTWLEMTASEMILARLERGPAPDDVASRSHALLAQWRSMELEQVLPQTSSRRPGLRM